MAAYSLGGQTIIDDDRNVIVGNIEVEPSSNVTAGTIQYNERLGVLRGFDGVEWVTLTEGEQTPNTNAILAWGKNPIGDGTTNDASTPTSITGGYTDWIKVSAGNQHIMAIRADGTAWGWGTNGSGQLGDGSPTNRSVPVSVTGGIKNWIQISASIDHTIGLRADGTAWGWGLNDVGQVGNNDTADVSVPNPVVGNFTDVLQVDAGGIHNALLRTNGTVWCWGEGQDGRLGNGSTQDRSSPVSVLGGITNFIQVSAGFNFTSALRADGTIWCWGRNSKGQLGDGSTTARSSPVPIVGGITDWTQISSGGDAAIEGFTIAIRSDGTAWSWGGNGTGALGNGGSGDRSSPVSVVGGFTDWVQVSAGSAAVLAIRSSGVGFSRHAWAWGDSTDLAMGIGTPIGTVNSPMSVAGGIFDWKELSVGLDNGAGIRSYVPI